MSASPGRLLALARRLAATPVRADADARALLGELGSADPAAELAALCDWYTGDDPRAVAWPRDRPAGVLRPAGFAGAEVVDEPLGAALCAPAFVVDGTLAPSLLAARFRPRRDPLIAATTRLLDPGPRAAAIEALLEPGPREAELHLALLQAAEAASLGAEGLPASLLAGLAERLLAIFEARAPAPLLDRAAPVLGALAGRAPDDRILDQLWRRFEAAARPVADPATLVPKRSFLDEVEGIREGRIARDEGYFRALPHRQLRNAAALALGRAAAERGGARAAGDRIGAQPGGDDDELSASFLEGVAAGPEREWLALLRPLLEAGGGHGDGKRALGLALLEACPAGDDSIRALVAAALEDPEPAAAIAAADALDLPTDLLAPLAKHRSRPAARAAVRALARRQVAIDWPAEATPAAARRRAFALAAAGLGGDGVGDALFEELSGDVEAHRDEAAAALGEWILAAPEGSRWLVRGLAGPPDTLVALLAALVAAPTPDALLRLDPADRDAVLETLRPRLGEGAEAALATAFLLGRLAPGVDDLAGWLDDALAEGKLPDDLDTIATMVAQLRVRDPRLEARLSARFEGADLPAALFAVTALAITATDAAAVARIEAAAALGTYGAAAAYQALTLLARERPDLL